MQTLLQIDFQGLPQDEALKRKIQEKIEAIEARFGRVTDGRIIVRAPSGRHISGGLYDINIHLSLPEGREVSISRTPQDDERYGKLPFALNDAFKRAERQLRQQGEKLHGDVKRPSRAPIGKIASIDPSGEFGFLDTDDGRSIYFHRNSLLNIDIERLKAGDRVSYHEEVGDEGPQASTVKRLGKHAMR